MTRILSEMGPVPDNREPCLTDAAVLMTQAVTAIVRPDSVSVAERERLAAALRLHRTWLLGWVALIEAEGRDDAETRIAAIRAKLQQRDITLPLPLRAMTGQVPA
ncbi:hypothetical protein [Gemmobacter sp.]|uniref:hypothetical protein n=1 Tax=Gemmobacter sp. TaxID=1898957 RepID=UPI002AFEDB30|nr:hypothetical protein [Gemmobacter sp.]